MKITLLAIGKTDRKELSALIDIYEKRLIHYVPFQFTIIPDIKNSKNMTPEQQVKKEAGKLLSKLDATDTVILLDEKGRDYTSVKFSGFLQQHMVTATKHLVFIIGGPYGFDKEISARANGKISLSKMTFSHQMVRLFFVEQLYRAFTILRGEPYHHH